MHQNGQISVKPENIFPIIRQWLYSEQEIFLRELIANAIDASSKLKFMLAIGNEDTIPEQELCVEISLDQTAGTLQICDFGVGMTQTEINKYINEIAYSGLLDFVEMVENKGVQDTQIIGHFGLGFYSAFMVAKKVEIDSLSFQTGAEAAHWSSADGINYTISKGTREQRGTTITIHFSDEAREVYTAEKIKALVHRHCNFMPLPIYFSETSEKAESESDEADKSTSTATQATALQKMQNQPNPLWQKAAKDITDEEANAFYKQTFGEMNDPVFWFPLNLDYPLRLRGLLFFPHMSDARDIMDGCIKMYSNQVFVADNMKELLPEHLFMLRGCLDCPDLPLNVSRSFLQTDATVQKMASHIVRKVAERLVELATKERERYEKIWENIRFFVEIVMLRDETFAKKVRPALMFSTVEGKKMTLDELGEGKHPYITEPNSFVAAVAVATQQKEQVLILDNPWSSQLIALLEQESNNEHTFLRVDDWLKQSSNKQNDEAKIAPPEWLIELLNDDKLTVEIASLGVDAPLCTMICDENSRRMADWQQMMQRYMPDASQFEMPLQKSLLLNHDHPLLASIIALESEEKRREMTYYLRDQARLCSGELSGSDLLDHISRQERIALEWLRKN